MRLGDLTVCCIQIHAEYVTKVATLFCENIACISTRGKSVKEMLCAAYEKIKPYADDHELDLLTGSCFYNVEDAQKVRMENSFIIGTLLMSLKHMSQEKVIMLGIRDLFIREGEWVDLEDTF